MRMTIVSGNPKKDGLCQSIIEAVMEGGRQGGAQVEEVRLCDYDIQVCKVCGTGWGPCRNEHYCTYGDDGFDEVREKVINSDVIVLATPVYWWEVSEALKIFLDRLRRVEFLNGGLKDKQVLLIASPGGTGNGMLSCLEQMERFCRHTGAVIFDYIGINRWNRDYKKVAAFEAAKALAQGRKAQSDI